MGTLFTVQGTGVDMWTGYPADTARQLTDVWRWQPVGNYPASVFPMNTSVAQGRAELVRLIRATPGAFALAGYSQGAIVTSQVYKHDLADPAGVLHDRLSDVVSGVTWGNPMREAGHTFPGDFHRPTGRGIAGDRLAGTPRWWRDYAHKGDIYTDTPNDDTGQVQTFIYNVVMANWAGSPDSIAAQVSQVTGASLGETLVVTRAVLDGLGFVLATPPTAQHINYDITPAVEYLRSVAPVAGSGR